MNAPISCARAMTLMDTLYLVVRDGRVPTAYYATFADAYAAARGVCNAERFEVVHEEEGPAAAAMAAASSATFVNGTLPAAAILMGWRLPALPMWPVGGCTLHIAALQRG